MMVEKLRNSIRSIPGVSLAEVSLGPDDEPLVRVWTDGTRPDADVRSAVELAIAMIDSGIEPGDLPGYGEDSEITIPNGFLDQPPGSVNAAIEVASPTGRIAKLAIEESIDCVEVRAVDNAGRSGTAVVAGGEQALNNAIAVAVARLRNVAEPESIGVDTREVDGSTVVTALVDLPSGERVVGAAIATGGQPFAVGRALDAALSDAR